MQVTPSIQRGKKLFLVPQYYQKNPLPQTFSQNNFNIFNCKSILRIVKNLTENHNTHG